MAIESILVSACLLGEKVRYDGGDKACAHAILQRWQSEGRIVSACPEIAGGLPVPRLPCEITEGAGGLAFLEGQARVVGSDGQDFSAPFARGAECTLARARTHKIRIAVLKEGSPSCGSGLSPDGSFSSTKVEKPGVTAALLQQAGIHVFNEFQWEEAKRLLSRLEAENPPR